jgi:hypothetical protein
MAEYGEDRAVQIEDKTRAMLRQVDEALQQSIIGTV